MRIPSFKPTELRKLLEKQGFKLDRQSGSHVVLLHPDGRRALIPMHNRDLKRGTLLGIIKQAGYSLDDFSKLL
jgi:predicted RNA binding protein YcfA (HicA-like mRNA interferase family)